MAVIKRGKDKKDAMPTASAGLAKADGLLQERALLVRFSVGRWYGTGADQEVAADVGKRAEATGDVGTFTKKFMDRKRLEGINTVTSEARGFHKKHTMPWGDAGQRLLPVDGFFEYKAKMTGYEQRFLVAVDQFITQFKEFCLAEKPRLGKLWKEADYPDVDTLRSRFRFSLLVDPIPTADDFRVDLGAEQLEAMREDYRKQLHEATKLALEDLWERLARLVEDAVEKLKDENRGLNRNSFSALRDIVDLLPRLDVTRDPKLAAMAKEVETTLLSIDIGDVRAVPASRQTVAKNAQKLLDRMSVFSKKGGAK